MYETFGDLQVDAFRFMDEVYGTFRSRTESRRMLSKGELEKVLLDEFGISNEMPVFATHLEHPDASVTLFYHYKYREVVLICADYGMIYATRDGGKTWAGFSCLESEED